jgi:hypothetical protein
MKPALRALSVALLVIVAACGGGGDRSGPVGLWRIDADATLAANQLQIEGQLADMLPAGRAQERAEFERLFKSVNGTLELNVDKTLVSNTMMDGKKQTMHGNWKIDGDTITMKSRPVGSEVDSVLTGSVGSDRMTVKTVGTEQFVVFQRDGH